MMSEQGYLDGSRMAAVFNMLRPRDLIWPYVVNNYLLGKKPSPSTCSIGTRIRRGCPPPIMPSICGSSII